MDNENYSPASTLPSLPPGPVEDQRRQRQIIVVAIIIIIVFLAAVVGGVIYLIQPTSPTERIRDIFIIFLALESLILGLALVTLIIQLARLINLLQNEIKPILDSTNETVSTLRGTTAFLSENMVEPVIKLNSYLAALTQMMKVVNLGRRRPGNTKT